MENKSKLTHDKIKFPRTSSKPNLSKLLTQRKSINTIPLLKKLSDYQDKLPIVEHERQNPMIYLESLQSSHQDVQKSLEESLNTNSKWRSYNSPIQTPKDRSKQKENYLFDTLYGKRKELSAIKVYNHVNNDKEISTKNYDQPEYVQFLQQAVSKSTRNTHTISSKASTTATPNFSTKRMSKTKKGLEIKQNYTIGEHRKELQTLEQWIKSKVESFESHQNSGELMFTDRINFMNMAFCEVSQIVGTFSTESKGLIEYLHKKYHEYYNFLTECMIEQNTKLKAELKLVEDRLLNSTKYYQEKLTKIKEESEKKGEKVVLNFQKCIQAKKSLETENKQIKHTMLNYQKKTKFVEQALIKVITLFLALGHKNIQQMTFSLDSFSPSSSYIQKSMLGKSKKNLLTEEEVEIEKRKRIFQQWCGYLIKMIHRILAKEIAQREGNDVRTVIFKKQAFDVIKQYMTENDDSISPADAQNILNKFLYTEEEEFKIRRDLKNASLAEEEEKEKDLIELQRLNKKFENMYSEVAYQLPTFEDVYNKITVHDVQCQANLPKEIETSAVQTFIERIETGIMVLPRVKSKQVNASSELRQKNDIDSGVTYFCEVFEAEKLKQNQSQKNSKANKKSKEKNKKLKQHQKDVLLKLPASSNKIFNLSERSLRNNETKTQLYENKRESRFLDESQKTFHSIGVNTNITKVSKAKTVDFIIPEFQDEDGLARDVSITEYPETQNKNVSQNKLNRQQSIDLQILKESMKSIPSQKQISDKKIGKPRRKNGFLISVDAKLHLSQKYIRSQSSISDSSEVSIEKDEEVANLEKKFSKEDKVSDNRLQSSRTNNFLKKQQSHCEQKSIQNGRTTLQKQRRNHFKLFSKTKKKHLPLEERLGRKRSYFKLSQIQYATKEDADLCRNKSHLIRVPKKKILREKVMIDPHDFHLQMAFKNSQKIRFLTSVTLWPPKLMFEMKKIRQRVQNIRPLTEIRNDSMNLLKSYMTNIVNPILKDFLKSYCQLMKNDKFDFGQNMALNNTKGSKSSNLKKQNEVNSKICNASSQLSYNQKLSPLLYNVINFTQYHQNRTSSENELFFSGLKSQRFKSSKMEVYNLLIEGRSVEVDIFVKTIYQFNVQINNNNTYNPEISYFTLENEFCDVLDGYFMNSQIQKILLEVKKFILSGHQSGPYRRASIKNEMKKESMKNLFSRKLDSNAKIGCYDLLLIVFRHIKERQQIQQKKYSMIKEVISKNSDYTAYEDIMHFLQCLPIQNDKRKKILDNCLKYVMYWSSSQGSVPNDIFYFILDKSELYNSGNGQSQNADLVKEYIVNRCELYFKTILHKVMKNPEMVINSTYIFSFKIPKIFYRILHQIRTCKTSKQKKPFYCLLTLIFCGLIDTQMEKRFMPCLFNGFLAVPLS